MDHHQDVNVGEGFKELWNAAWPIALILFGLAVLGVMLQQATQNG